MYFIKLHPFISVKTKTFILKSSTPSLCRRPIENFKKYINRILGYL